MCLFYGYIGRSMGVGRYFYNFVYVQFYVEWFGVIFVDQFVYIVVKLLWIIDLVFKLCYFCVYFI